MFFFLMLLMGIAGLVIGGLMLGIGWRAMLALESLARSQREVVLAMRMQPAASAPLAHERESEHHVIMET